MRERERDRETERERERGRDREVRSWTGGKEVRNPPTQTPARSTNERHSFLWLSHHSFCESCEGCGFRAPAIAPFSLNHELSEDPVQRQGLKLSRLAGLSAPQDLRAGNFEQSAVALEATIAQGVQRFMAV